MIKKLDWSLQKDRMVLLESVRKNELFIGSTDTVLGLMGSIDAETQKKIDNAKQRREKPYIIVQDSMKKVLLLASIPTFQIETFLKLCWPGPVTVILPKSPQAPAFIGAQETVAIRIPQHEGLHYLLKELPYGLYSTSANISGEPIPKTLHEVSPAILDACSYVITDDEVDDVPSTIVDCSHGDVRLVRQGAYPFAQLLDLYRQAAN